MGTEKVIQLDSATISIGSDGIIRISIKEDFEVELHDAQEMYRVIDENTGGAENLIFVKPGIGSTVSRDVRDFIRRKPSVSIAEAILVDNLAHRLMVNFITKFHRPDKKVKVFSSEEKAVDWLKKQKTSTPPS